MAADPNQLKVVKNLGFDGIFFAMARVPNSGRLFYGGSDFKVYEIDTAEEKPQPSALSGEGHQSYVTGAALSTGGLVTGSYDGRLIWWDADERRQTRAVDAHDLWIRGVVASPEGRVLSSVADDMVCKLWDAESGELIHALKDHQPVTPHNYPSMLYVSAFSPDGRLLATGDKVGHVVVWNVETGEKLAELETPVMYTWDPRQRRHSIGGVRSLAFTPDSERLAVGGIGKIGNIDHLGGPARIEIFNWQSGQRLHELEDDKHKGLVEQIAFHPDGRWFLSAGGDHNGFLTFYDAETGKIIRQDKAPMHVHRFAFNETYDALYAVGHGRIAVWELKAAEPAASEQPAETDEAAEADDAAGNR